VAEVLTDIAFPKDGASLSFSIIGGGKLWGLFACHHHSPRHLAYTVRGRCA